MLTNISASVCQDTVSWSPPPCQANCTVNVSGQDIIPVPCSDGNVRITDVDLSNKTVTVTATDQLGNLVEVSAKSDEGTQCTHAE